MEAFIECFSIIPDPRAMNAQHDLMEILFIALASHLCGGKTCTDMEDFGHAKKDVLQEILELPYGIPSHDTFSNVLARLDPEALSKAFARFMAAFNKNVSQEKIIAIDGKALRRAFMKGKRTSPPMLVTAWGSELRMILNSREVIDGNESAAAIELLQLIDVKGSIVTADALHCTRPMAEAIISRGGDYVLALKKNQIGLLSEAENLFSVTRDMPTASTEEKGHGRCEMRQATVIDAPQLAAKHDFKGLTALGRIESMRTIEGITETATRFFVLSRSVKPTQLLHIVRAHWGVENCAHWALDVVMDEDLARNRTSKGSLRVKTKRAGWQNAFLFKLLAHMR
ncbi:MAG: ISAs1 family transposase [Chitinophagia bacterium]|nr:ISAs1 family transposase [Chitinophagia bacterium]